MPTVFTAYTVPVLIIYSVQISMPATGSGPVPAGEGSSVLMQTSPQGTSALVPTASTQQVGDVPATAQLIFTPSSYYIQRYIPYPSTTCMPVYEAHPSLSVNYDCIHAVY